MLDWFPNQILGIGGFHVPKKFKKRHMNAKKKQASTIFGTILQKNLSKSRRRKMDTT